MPSARAGYSKVPVPKVFHVLRIIQLIFGLAVLGISAYHIYFWRAAIGNQWSMDYAGLGLFTGIATLIFIVYWLAAGRIGGRLYNYWAILAVEILMVILWLCTFSLLASRVALFKRATSEGAGSHPFLATLYTALVLSAANFALFVITFITYTIQLFKHRKTLSAEQAQNRGNVESGANVATQPVHQ